MHSYVPSEQVGPSPGNDSAYFNAASTAATTRRTSCGLSHFPCPCKRRNMHGQAAVAEQCPRPPPP
eukprot:SAG22_NODE_4748_length_1175_cov_2.355019_1_plen_65_part_10